MPERATAGQIAGLLLQGWTNRQMEPAVEHERVCRSEAKRLRAYDTGTKYLLSEGVATAGRVLTGFERESER